MDPANLRAPATFEQPKQLAQGMSWVLVNGVPVIADGKMTDALPGKVLEGTSGLVVDAIGYPHFFLYTASLSIPALLLIFLLSRPAHRHALP